MGKKNKSLENSNEKCIDKKQVGGGRNVNSILNNVDGKILSKQSNQDDINFYKYMINKIIGKIENPKLLKQICQLAEYYYIYK